MTQANQQHAVIYARISDPKQTGLGSQETRCREFARMKGYHVTKVFHDDMTGSLATRPGMKTMLVHLRKHRHQNPVAIIDDISRLARGVTAHWELRSLITRAGGKLESPSIEFKEDSDSIFIENVLASAAQHQREKNAEQTKNRMRARVMNGYWCFQAPIGYEYKSSRERGRVLVRKEPYASILQEALEGYASRRFETQTEMKRFLESQPAYPKDAPGGQVRQQRVVEILTRPVYAGMVEAPKWSIAMRKGQHEGLISLRTYNRIQERLKGTARTPNRKDLNADFPLRGAVLCGDCGKPLTAAWSKGKGGRYAYYSCKTKGCKSSRKSIPRAKIEGQFVELLKRTTPTQTILAAARDMFRNVWDQRLTHCDDIKTSLRKNISALEKQIDGLLERIIEADSPTVIRAYEKKISTLEADKIMAEEKLNSGHAPVRSFEEMFSHTMTFLSNPLKLWENGGLTHKRAVLKLAFAHPLTYHRNNGYRTPELSSPFKLLEEISGGKNKMVRLTGETSNTLFNELAAWNNQLKHLEDTDDGDDLMLPS